MPFRFSGVIQASRLKTPLHRDDSEGDPGPAWRLPARIPMVETVPGTEGLPHSFQLAHLS